MRRRRFSINIEVYFIFQIIHTQHTIQDKIGYIFRLELAITRPITMTLNREVETANK